MNHQMKSNTIALKLFAGSCLVGLIITTLACHNNRHMSQATGSPSDPVEIATQLDSQMFPPTWTVPPVNASAKPIAASELERALACTRRAFAKYPAQMLTANLNRVYLVNDLRFSGIMAGGTYSTDTVFMSVDTKSEGFSDDYIEGTFHHEFSSVLYYLYPRNFREKEWNAANPKGYKYNESGTDAVKEGKDSEAYDPELSKKGFLSQYASWSQEEDFNTIAAAMFAGDENLWAEFDRHSPIESKVKIMIDFYAALDKTFDETFFRDLATKQ